MSRPRPAPDASPNAAETAEAHYRRMCRLGEMSAAQLARALADEPGPWIETAARYGVAEAQVRLGQLRLEDGRSEEALCWFERAAAKGSAEAMNMLGRAAELGWAGPADDAAAARWYRRAAEAGDPWGQYNYANLLFDGRGVPRDEAQALAWYRLAAGQGHARAMNLLGRCAEEGWGGAADMAAARDWYRRSAEGGYFRGAYNHAACLAADGRLDEARAWLDAALEEAPNDQRPALLAALRDGR